MYRDDITQRVNAALKGLKTKVLVDVPFPSELKSCGQLAHISFSSDNPKTMFGDCEEERVLRFQVVMIAPNTLSANALHLDIHKAFLKDPFFNNNTVFDRADVDPDHLAERITVLTAFYDVTIVINSLSFDLVL